MTQNQKEFRKINRIAAIYNLAVSLLWTALFLVPTTIYCYKYVDPKLVFIFLPLSFIPIFFPNSFFDKIQLSKNPAWYRRIGVKYINALAQHGRVINRILREKHPGFKSISSTKASIRKQYNQTYFFEKFHFFLFLFFIIITIHAAIQGRLNWVLIISVSNVLYNVYPNLLQQYIRAKLKSSDRAYPRTT